MAKNLCCHYSSLKFIPFLLFIFLSFGLMNGQTCPDRGARFLSQADIDIYFATYPGCKEILGNVDIASGITDLTPFDNIERINGALIVRVNEDSHSSILFKSLKEVGGDFSFLASETSKDTLSDFPLLNTVGGRVNIRNIQCDNDLESLESIGTDLLLVSIPSTNFIRLPNLRRVGGIIAIINNPNLLEINGFENLKSLGGIEFSKNPLCHTITGFSNVDSIWGDFELDNNQSLTEFIAFQNTNYLGGKLTIHNEPTLQSFGGFSSLNRIEGELEIENNENLETITAFDNLKSTGDFLFSTNSSFIDLNSFNNLNEINGDLEFVRNEELQSISGLSNLLTINRTLKILANKKLNNITGLSDVESIKNQGSDIYGVTIVINDLLSDCAIQSICRHIVAPGNSILIESNGPGCSYLGELDCGNRGIVGTVFFDVNNNGVKDEREFGIPEQRILRSEDGLISLTNQDGVYFFYREDEEPNTVAWVESEDWILTSDSMQYIIDRPFNSFETEDYFFSLRPTNPLDSGTVVISSDATRCNTIVNFKMRYKNQGTEIINGFIELTYQDSLTRLDSSDVDPIFQDDNIIRWAVDELFPQEYRDINMRIEMPTEQSTGEVIGFVAEFFSEKSDSVELLHRFQVSNIIRCSYDPNDKLVNPIGVGDANIIDPGTDLVYTVRFQNTGNAEAINISIKDTIDQNLDMETFQVLNSSFPVNTFLMDHFVQFDFNNIWLPDSTSNEPESHGFVTFSISPKTDLSLGAAVYNSASIFFDANPPIHTNTTIATYDVISNVEDLKAIREFVLYPNPSDGLVNFSFHSDNSDPLKILIYNTYGQLMVRRDIGVVSDFNEFQLDVSALENGLYFVHVIQNRQRATVLLTKQK